MGRIKEIDIVKGLAIIFVVCIHICAPGSVGYPISSPSWSIIIFLGSIVRSGVPLFFMASGALMLDPEREVSIGKIYKKYIRRFLIVLFTWASLYELYFLGISTYLGYFSKERVFEMFKNILSFNHFGPLYFMQLIIVFYIFIPIIRAFIKAADRKELRYGLILWFLFGVVWPMALNFKPLNLMGGQIGNLSMDMVYSSIGYGVLGYYINNYKEEININPILIYLLGLGLTFIPMYFMSIRTGENAFIFWEGNSPNVCLMAAGIFIHIMKSGIEYRPLYGKLSQASFFIYLSHTFINISLSYLGMDIASYNPIFYLLIVGPLEILVCYIAYKYLSKIDFIRKNFI